MLFSHHEWNIWQALAKVDNRILKLSRASWVVTFAAGQVVMHLLCSANPMIAHVLLLTRYTNFQVCVSMQLCKILRRDSALSVEAINVLTYNELKMITLH